MELLIDRMATPVGGIVMVSDGENLRALDFEDYTERMQRLLARQYGEVVLRDRHDPGGIRRPLERYFDGDIEAVTTIDVATAGTPFQQTVWAKLRDIPAGRTWSYGELARAIGKPGASRAVGLANGNNPIAIVVPCHRVIGASGGLTGYAGGVERKRWLLTHEGVALA